MQVRESGRELSQKRLCKGAFLFAGLVAEKVPQAKREVDHRRDDDESHQPVPEFVENRDTAADPELDEVITSPSNNRSDSEPSR